MGADEILANNTTPDLWVYVVWFSIWDSDGVADPRVVGPWDEEMEVGN